MERRKIFKGQIYPQTTPLHLDTVPTHAPLETFLEKTLQYNFHRYHFSLHIGHGWLIPDKQMFAFIFCIEIFKLTHID